MDAKDIALAAAGAGLAYVLGRREPLELAAGAAIAVAVGALVEPDDAAAPVGGPARAIDPQRFEPLRSGEPTVAQVLWTDARLGMTRRG